MELFLIAGHDAHNAVCVQIPGQVIHLQAASGKLLYGELKQGGIVSLVMELTEYDEKHI